MEDHSEAGLSPGQEESRAEESKCLGRAESTGVRRLGCCLLSLLTHSVGGVGAAVRPPWSLSFLFPLNTGLRMIILRWGDLGPPALLCWISCLVGSSSGVAKLPLPKLPKGAPLKRVGCFLLSCRVSLLDPGSPAQVSPPLAGPQWPRCPCFTCPALACPHATQQLGAGGVLQSQSLSQPQLTG